MTRICRSCSNEIIAEGGRGRPSSYCSVGCRRVAEHEIRRLDRALAQLETDARWLRNPAAFHLDAEADTAFNRSEIASTTARLRALLADDDQ